MPTSAAQQRPSAWLAHKSTATIGSTRWCLLHCSRCPTAVRAVSLCAAAGSPLELVQPETLRWKAFEPVLLLGKQRFSNVDIRIRVKVRGGCGAM